MIGCLINQKKKVVTDAIKETLIEVAVLKVQKLDRWKSLSQNVNLVSSSCLYTYVDNRY